MKKFMLFLLKAYMLPLNIMCRLLGEKGQKALKIRFSQLICRGNQYNEISFVPKDVNEIGSKGTNRDFSDTAVILQGPIITKDDFTADSVRLYQQYNNNVKIIVSTWKDSDPDAVKRIREMGADVLLSDYPGVNGVGNINYQLTTSLAGVKAAKIMGVKYVLKTRTDQRFYNPCALDMMVQMHREGSLIMLGGIYNSFCTKCFQISDFMAFGEVLEMELLYSLPHDGEDTREIGTTRKNQKKGIPFFEKYIEMILTSEQDARKPIPKELQDTSLKYANPETLLAYGYFSAKEDVSNYTSLQEAYTDFLRKYVIIIDADSVGFFWPKYAHEYYRRDYFDREGKLDMARWLSMTATK